MRFPGGFEGVFESETLKKSPCERGVIWGSKHENSSSALKSAIDAKSLLSDLSKLLQGNFYLLSTTLRDLKGGSWFYFCAFEMVGILVFLSVASPQLQESQLLEGAVKLL